LPIKGDYWLCGVLPQAKCEFSAKEMEFRNSVSPTLLMLYFHIQVSCTKLLGSWLCLKKKCMGKIIYHDRQVTATDYNDLLKKINKIKYNFKKITSLRHMYL
jgi:hypothetical protein